MLEIPDWPLRGMAVVVAVLGVLSLLMRAAAAEPARVPLPPGPELWEARVFPPEGVSPAEAATLRVASDPVYGTRLELGPWRSGVWGARFQLRSPQPVLQGVLQGRYRTEGLGFGVLEVGIEYLEKGERGAVKRLGLAPSEEWHEFRFVFRTPPPGADQVRPLLSLRAHTEGRALFAELALLTEAPALELPAAPGLLTRPRPPRSFPASGYYRLAEKAGAWWLVTPEGEPFYSLGCDGPWFRSEQERVTAAPAAAARLAEAGFNSLAGWTSVADWGRVNEERVAAGEAPFAMFRALETGAWQDRCDPLVDAAGRTTGEGHAFADPFDPRFAAAYRAEARGLAKHVRGRAWFVAYFADNEISHADLYRHVYSSHCAAALKEFLVARYGGDIRALNLAWGTGFASFDELIASRPEPAVRLGAHYQDYRRFARVLVARYIDVTLRVLREEDPDHLVISNRFMLGDVEAWVDYLDLYARYDAIAVNLYPANQTAGLSEAEQGVYRLVHERTGRPVLVGEWSIPAVDSGLYDDPARLDWSWNEVVATQQERARQAACVMRDFFNLPFVVGSHWFIWQDVDTERRRANRGLVRADGAPWPKLTEALGAISARLQEALQPG